MLDLLITNGLIIDGTASPGFHAAVGVQGDTVSLHRGDVSGLEAARTIDAAGRVVCPGFIDLHSHAGLTMLGEPHHDPKVRQGVTTELVGIDGISHAPFKTQEELHRYIWLDSGLNGYPPMPADWLTVADFIGKFDGSVAINVAYILGNSPVRIWGVGWNDRPATQDEMANMRAVVREAMEEGAWGLSTGLDYPPGAYADTDELVALSETAASMGGFYHTHTRASLLSTGLLAPWEEALEIGRRSGIPIHLTHYRQSAQGVGSHLDYLGLVEDARAEGMDVTFDCYTYPYSGTTITIGLPFWAKDGGPERLMAALQRPRRPRSYGKRAGSEQARKQLADQLHPPAERAVRRQASDRHRRDAQPGACGGAVRPAAGGEPGYLDRGTGHERTHAARLRLPPGGHDRVRRHPVRRVSQPAHVRLLPDSAGGVREGREAPASLRGDPQDDLVPGPASRPAGPGHTEGRVQGRHRRVQPRHGQDPRQARRSQALPRRHRLRDRQRPGGHRRRRQHRRPTRPAACAGAAERREGNQGLYIAADSACLRSNGRGAQKRCVTARAVFGIWYSLSERGHIDPSKRRKSNATGFNQISVWSSQNSDDIADTMCQIRYGNLTLARQM